MTAEMIKAKGKKKGLLAVVSVCLALLLLLLVVGCAAAPKYSNQGEGIDMAAPAVAPSSPMERGPGGERSYKTTEDPFPSTAGQRHIIQHAFLYLEVRNIDEVVTDLQKLTDQAGGYVASREIYNLEEERRAGSVSLRVPADRFAPFLSVVKELGKVKNERVYTDDVTMQYIDLEARIANLAAQEKRLRELLERAESIEDIMQVERELGRIRGELESMEGSFRYLRERVQFSEVNIQLEERDPRTLVVDDKFSGFGERLGRLLVLNANRFLAGLSGFIIVAIGSLPILLPLLLIAFLIWKAAAALKKGKNKKRGEQNLPQNR